jgi:hypothetical protein
MEAIITVRVRVIKMATRENGEVFVSAVELSGR